MNILLFYLSCLDHSTLDRALGSYLQKGLQRSSQQKLSKSNIKLCTNEMHTFNCWGPLLFIED